MRTLKQHEVADGCSPGEVIYFRIPLRGLPNLSQTVSNVFNKFSVRFHVRAVIVYE